VRKWCREASGEWVKEVGIESSWGCKKRERILVAYTAAAWWALSHLCVSSLLFIHTHMSVVMCFPFLSFPLVFLLTLFSYGPLPNLFLVNNSVLYASNTNPSLNKNSFKILPTQSRHSLTQGPKAPPQLIYWLGLWLMGIAMFTLKGKRLRKINYGLSVNCDVWEGKQRRQTKNHENCIQKQKQKQKEGYKF